MSQILSWSRARWYKFMFDVGRGVGSSSVELTLIYELTVSL